MVLDPASNEWTDPACKQQALGRLADELAADQRILLTQIIVDRRCLKQYEDWLAMYGPLRPISIHAAQDVSSLAGRQSVAEVRFRDHLSVLIMVEI